MINKEKKRRIEAEAALESILNTLDHPHDHAYSEIEFIAREWEKKRKKPLFGCDCVDGMNGMFHCDHEDAEEYEDGTESIT